MIDEQDLNPAGALLLNALRNISDVHDVYHALQHVDTTNLKILASMAVTVIEGRGEHD